MAEESLEPLIELINGLMAEKLGRQAAQIAGLQFSLIALSKRLIANGVIAEKELMADLDAIVSSLAPGYQASDSALMVHRLMQAISGQIGPKPETAPE
jgi:hypothetical protein